MRSKLTLIAILSALSLPATAAWTGISAFAGQHESNWSFGNRQRTADSFQYGLAIEENTQPGLRIGLGIGQFHLRLREDLTNAAISRYDGEFLMFFMRWPIKLQEAVSLHLRFDYQYNNGRRSDDNTEGDIDWVEAGFTAGLAIRAGHVSLHPYVRYRSVDGDLSDTTSSSLFDHQENRSYGINLDIHVETTAYVRLSASFEETESLSISFVREY